MASPKRIGTGWINRSSASQPISSAIIREHEAARAADRVELDQARAGLLEQRFEIEALKARLVSLLRMTFGRPSENLQTQLEQLEFTLADLDESLAATLPPDDQADEPLRQ